MANTDDWNDDVCEDLGAPPPPSADFHQSEERYPEPIVTRQSYVSVAVTVKPVILPSIRSEQASWTPLKAARQTRRPVRKPAVVTEDRPCENCHLKPAHYKFGETHFASQPKEGLHRLNVGTYCIDCVTAAAPRCGTPECQGRKVISRPEATYPFQNYCTSCIANYKQIHG